MKPRSRTPVALVAAFLILTGSRLASAQSVNVGNVGVKLTIPDGVTKLRGVLAFTARGLASGWASSAPFQDLAKRLNAGIAIVSGGDDLNDGSYPGRCKSGEFDNVPNAFKMLATMASHPELANIPLVGLGHSHGGDYWNWFNACHPDRMAMVFVHASGGVNYSAASLHVPVFYTLGTQDLVERGSGKPRAGMFVNRAKGAPMTMVIGVGGHDTQFGADEYTIVTALIEGIFNLRVPASADPAKGPVVLNDLDEKSGGYWLGDFYTKEIARYADFKGDKAKTSFLPSEDLANKWKTNGPALPMNIQLPTDDCSWCGHPKDEPAWMAGGPTATPGTGGPTPPVTADGGVIGSGGSADAGSEPPTSTPPVTTPPTSTPPVTIPPSTTPPVTTPPSGTGGTAGTPVTPPRRPSGGCSYTPASSGGGLLALGALGALMIARRRRR
jgi:MYXO-CTERM domain-containing protein